MSYLQNYMIWNSGTEVPEQYFFWSGISSLASLVNGKVWINMGKFQYYPNMYIVLLGPPGNGKTVCIDRAEEVVRRSGDILLSGQSETAEGLVRFLRDKGIRTITFADGTVPYTPISLYLSELSNFLGKDPAGMIDFLTGVWDRGGRQYHRRTKGQGEDMLPRPNVNLLAGTTQDWITQYLKADIVGGGFTRRVVFVDEGPRDDSKRVPWPEDTPEMTQARDNCVAYAVLLQNLQGQFVYAPGAKFFFENWYIRREIPKESDVRGYHMTKPALLLKTGMLVALSRAPELTLTQYDLEIALELLNATEKRLRGVFQGIGKNVLNAVAVQVLNMLSAAPEKAFAERRPDGSKHEFYAKWMDRKQIEALIYKDAKGMDIKDIFDHLISSDKVKILSVPLAGGVQRTLFLLTESIREKAPDLSQDGTTPKQ